MFSQAEYETAQATHEQLKCLQEENVGLKCLIRSLKASDSSPANNCDRTCDCELKYKSLFKKYEHFLDNIMRQLLNALKMQEAIRFELDSIEAIKHNKPSEAEPRASYQITNKNDEAVEAINRFHMLLSEQQHQQLGMLNDLSLISKIMREETGEETNTITTLFKSMSSCSSLNFDNYPVDSMSQVDFSKSVSIERINYSSNASSNSNDLIKFNEYLLNDEAEANNIKQFETTLKLDNKKAHLVDAHQGKFSDTFLKEIKEKYEGPPPPPKLDQEIANASCQNHVNTDTSKCMPFFQNKTKLDNLCKAINTNAVVDHKYVAKSGTSPPSKIPKFLKNSKNNITTPNSITSTGPTRSKDDSNLKLKPVVQPSPSSIPKRQQLKPNQVKQARNTPKPPPPVKTRKNVTYVPQSRVKSKNPQTKLVSAHNKAKNVINSNTFDKQEVLRQKKHEPILSNFRHVSAKKRYCFPTLKSKSLYYNNQYFSQISKKSKSNTIDQSKSSFKYLSETDINSLANRLTTFDKDLVYNVYHLDTLYSNIDYILFNSYASDTELVYNSNRRNNERNRRLLTSNYQLFINDYFNRSYQEDSEDLDEQKDADESDPMQDNKSNTQDLEEEPVGESCGFENTSQIALEFEENINKTFSNELIEFNYDFEEYELNEEEDNEYEEENEITEYINNNKGSMSDYEHNATEDVFNLTFEEEILVNEKNKCIQQYFETHGNTFDDMYLQIKESEIENLYLVQIKSPNLSTSSLSSLLTSSKSFIAKSLLTTSMSSSRTMSTNSSSLTIFSSSKKKRNRRNHGHRNRRESMFDDSLQTFEPVKNQRVYYHNSTPNDFQYNINSHPGAADPTKVKLNRRHSFSALEEFSLRSNAKMINYSKSEGFYHILNSCLLNSSPVLAHDRPESGKVLRNTISFNCFLESYKENFLHKDIIVKNVPKQNQSSNEGINKFNTDFYKLCSDTFLNESNYNLSQSNHTNTNQKLDRFKISYQF